MSGPLGDDDGGRRPPDPDGLRGFPPEWGRIVIPDDPSELRAESARIRRELRRDLLFRKYGLRSSRRLRHLALPLVLVIMAVLVATTSLFAAMWPSGNTQSGNSQSGTPEGNARDPGVVPTAAAATLRIGESLPAIDLADPDGRSVALRDLHPAVILLTRACDCAGLITGAARAATESKVPVLVVGGRDQPSLPPLPGTLRVRALTDPDGALFTAVADSVKGTPDIHTGAALLVDKVGKLVTLVPAGRSADGFTGQLPALTR
ncbi:MAG: hypothetical protein WCA46_09850 [Actinocatenispora sp.]